MAARQDPITLRTLCNTALRDEIRFRTIIGAGKLDGALNPGTLPPTPSQFREALMLGYRAYGPNNWATGEESVLNGVPVIDMESQKRELALIDLTCETYERAYYAWAYGPSLGETPSQWQLDNRGPNAGRVDPDVQLPDPAKN